MKILVLNPFAGQIYEKEHCLKIAGPNTEIVFKDISDVYPLPYVTYIYYRHFCADGAVDKIVQAEREGYDAAFIACMYDPGLLEAKEIVNIPVVGAFEASTHYACMMGNTYSIVTVEKKVIPCCWQLAELYGVSKKLASVRDIGIPANKLYPEITPSEEIIRRTIEVSRDCIEKDGAEVIVPGCTLQSTTLTHACLTSSSPIDKFEELTEDIGGPIIDPILIGLKTAEMMAELRNKVGIPPVSRVAAWKKPPEEELRRLRKYYGKDK